MKQVYVNNNEGEPLEHDYDLRYEENKIVCLFSYNSDWTEHLNGKKAGSIKEVEEGYLIEIGTQKMRLDYGDIQVLKILLLADKNDVDYFEIRESKTIKTWPKATGIEESLR